MPVYFAIEGAKGVAYFRAHDEAEDVFVAAVARDVYETDARVRSLFADLVAAVADHFRRTHVAEAVDPVAWIAELPCAKCDSPLAADVLHRARQSASIVELNLSPGGVPAGCCRRQVLAAFRQSDSPQLAARR
jgi:hypothetical protein